MANMGYEDRFQSMSKQEPIVESTNSDVIASTFEAVSSIVKKLESRNEILNEIIATLGIERNRQTAKDNPELFVKTLYEFYDERWAKRVKANPV